MHEEGEELNVELIRVTENGRGVAFAEDGKIIIVDNVDYEDTSAKIQITKSLEQSYFARKIGNLKAKQRETISKEKSQTKKSSPYELDGEDQPEDEDDDESLFDEDEEETED